MDPHITEGNGRNSALAKQGRPTGARRALKTNSSRTMLPRQWFVRLRMQDTCWSRCIPGVKRDALDAGESSCIDRCVNKVSCRRGVQLYVACEDFATAIRTATCRVLSGTFPFVYPCRSFRLLSCVRAVYRGAQHLGETVARVHATRPEVMS